jgi:AraC-like DNA-binding protein
MKPFEKRFFLKSEICGPALEIARQLDIALDPVFAEMHLSDADLADPAFLISAEQYFLLLEKILEVSGDKTLGLHAGRLASYGALGILGLGVLSAPCFHDALVLGASYAVISGAIGRTGYVQGGNRAAFEFEIATSRAGLSRYLTDEQFASIYSYLPTVLGEEYRLDTGSKVIADEVHFKYPKPEKLDLYEEFFRCELFFDAPYNRMWFSKDTLALSLPLANESSFNLCREQCARELTKHDGAYPIVQEVQRKLLQSSNGFPSMDRLAKTLGLSPRTLRRQLQVAGVTYSGLLNEVKSQWADELLANHSLSIDHVAELLGYEETTNFRRAFKRWKGITPTQYRKVYRA